MSDILIALAFVVCVAASVVGCAMWSVHTLSARADRTVQDRIKRVKGIKRFYAINILPFPDSDLPDSMVENDHKENEGTQH